MDSLVFLHEREGNMAENVKRGRAPRPKRVRLYVVEEQEILQEAYKAAFPSEPTIDLIGIAGEGDAEAIMSALAELRPNAVLLGTKMLQPEVIDRLATVRERYPYVGIVLLATLYDVKGIKQLREFTKKSSKGCAFLLKHSIDRIDQLVQVIHAVTEGQVILDPLVMEGLIGAGDSRTAFLKDLTPRELEVLSWMAKELKNSTIADILCVDPKTIERHINSIYSKLNGTWSEDKHPRVSAIMLYLKATGQLSGGNIEHDEAMAVY
ncbi:response regulator transcription factor [Dehalococcoidia bacterium]|nr:response regulator transcription factor [Dehalococcoidia bacterium]MCL0064336.1 response regulator transcription factor [Dehalococcoidia bacterium]MCL0087716.1 response regulator transcription factor [Dehalococcoidia bacterium]MCL0103510.1 response regulator transcription factor [Dehalococcoidia bacterium]